MAGRRLRVRGGGAGRIRLRPLGFACALALVASAGCATPLMVEKAPATAGGSPFFVNTRLGYRIADPRSFRVAGDVATGSPEAGSSGRPWKRVEIEGADLAFRATGDPGVTTMVVTSRCDQPEAELRILARHLLIGVARRQWLGAGPAVVAGHDAWVQSFESLGDGVPVRVKTVSTRVGRDCVVDWVLASSGDFERSLPDFDRWWASFEPPAPGEGPS